MFSSTLSPEAGLNKGNIDYMVGAIDEASVARHQNTKYLGMFCCAHFDADNAR